jgi:hypothetical protein
MSRLLLVPPQCSGSQNGAFNFGLRGPSAAGRSEHQGHGVFRRVSVGRCSSAPISSEPYPRNARGKLNCFPVHRGRRAAPNDARSNSHPPGLGETCRVRPTPTRRRFFQLQFRSLVPDATNGRHHGSPHSFPRLTKLSFSAPENWRPLRSGCMPRGESTLRANDFAQSDSLSPILSRQVDIPLAAPGWPRR